jgi:crossover junction endodeoxyribonuclease RusA
VPDDPQPPARAIPTAQPAPTGEGQGGGLGPAPPWLSVFVAGRPIGQGSMRPRGAKAMTHDNPALRRWRLHIGWVARAALGTRYPIDLPELVVLRCAFTIRRKRRGDQPDLDKLVRAVQDALTGIAYENDKQVSVIGATRRMLEANDPDPEGLALEVERA